MKKEEFIKKYSNVNYYIGIIGHDSYIRIVDILDRLNIPSSNIIENNIYKIYLNLDRDAVDENSTISYHDFLNDWKTLSESVDENNAHIINEYLEENRFNFIKNSYKIIKLNSLIGILNADWINYITNVKYSIYWNNFNKDLIITIRNNGSFKIKF